MGEIKKAAALGILDGVTTNPSLIAKTGPQATKRRSSRSAEIVDGPVSCRGHQPRTSDEMLAPRRSDFVTWADNVIIKVPL